MALDYYKVLGISRSADEKEIKSAYRKLARKYHPDVNPNDAEAERKFKEIGEAYSVIGNPEKKKLYDKFGANWEQASHFGGGEGGAGNYQEGVNFGGEGFESLFEQFFQNFGGGESGFGRGGAVVLLRTSSKLSNSVWRRSMRALGVD
ncbi:MAG: DnaJ domain-containing protein [Fimbriimonadaceae bacterium]